MNFIVHAEKFGQLLTFTHSYTMYPAYQVVRNAIIPFCMHGRMFHFKRWVKQDEWIVVLKATISVRIFAMILKGLARLTLVTAEKCTVY